MSLIPSSGSTRQGEKKIGAVSVNWQFYFLTKVMALIVVIDAAELFIFLMQNTGNGTYQYQ